MNPSAHLILYVSNQAASARFYTRALNRVPRLDVPGMTEFDLGGGAVLGLMPEAGIRRLLGAAWPVAAPQAQPAPRAELYLHVDDVAASHARALAAGATELSAPGWRDWGALVAYALDPDGHVLAFANAQPSPAPASRVAAPAFPTLRTARLLLREITQDDAPALLSLHGDAALMRWYGTDPLTRLEQAQALVRTFAAWRALPNPGTRWGLALAQRPDALLGSCGLFGWNRAWRKCSIGYELASSAQGQGLMHEALRAVLGWGFEAMDLNRVEAQIHPDNAASLHLARALGFVEEGRLREVAFWGGHHHDLLQLALVRGQWPG